MEEQKLWGLLLIVICIILMRIKSKPKDQKCKPFEFKSPWKE